MKLFTKKEIKNKKQERLAVYVKKGLAVSKEMDKELKGLKTLKDTKKALSLEFEKQIGEKEAQKALLQREIDNLNAIRAREVKPVTELMSEVTYRIKEVEKRESEVEQRELKHESRLDEIKDEMDRVANRWGEVKILEDNLEKDLKIFSQEKIRVLHKNKEVTKRIENVVKKENQFNKKLAKAKYDLGLEKAEVMAYWKSIKEREKEIENDTKRLQGWEARLSKHHKRLYGKKR